MKTNIYFVRHAESNYVPEDDDFYRPLSFLLSFENENLKYIKQIED